MSSTLSIGKDINGAVCDTLSVADNLYSATLAAITETSIVVPSGVNVAYFSYGSSGDVWVSLKGIAAFPPPAFTQTTSELNPVSRYVVPGQTISVICSAINGIQISFYNNRSY